MLIYCVHAGGIMGKYNWNIDTLVSRLDILNKLIKKETDPEKLDDLQSDLEYLENLIYVHFNPQESKTPSMLEAYRDLKFQLKKIDFIWPDFKEFGDIVTSYIKVPRLKKRSFTKEELFELTHNFYKSLNPFFYHNFMRNFKMRETHTTFYNAHDIKRYVGETTVLPSLNETFIEITRSNTLDDPLTVIHEYGHATSTSINPYHLSMQKDIFTEVDTLFFEMLAADFLDKELGISEKVITHTNLHNEYFYCADKASLQIAFVETENILPSAFLRNKDLKIFGRTQLNLCDEEIEEIIQESDTRNYVYLNSYMYAIELYELYKKDPEKALYILKQVILLRDMTRRQYYEKIKQLGLIANSSLQDYRLELIEQAPILQRTKRMPFTK